MVLLFIKIGGTGIEIKRFVIFAAGFIRINVL